MAPNLLYAASLSSSPLQAAFAHIEWDFHVTLSKPEQALLISAEEHPLEYTLHDYHDAFGYARLLLKVLDQVITITGIYSISDVVLVYIYCSSAGLAEHHGGGDKYDKHHNNNCNDDDADHDSVHQRNNYNYNHNHNNNNHFFNIYK